MTANLCPSRNQRGCEARARRGVRILIRGNIDSVSARSVDYLDGLGALAPNVASKRLDVRDVNWDLCFSAYANCLADRAEQADCVRAFIAHVRVVDPAALRSL